MRNRSSCCSFGHYDSSHPSESCADQDPDLTTDSSEETVPLPPKCTVRVAATYLLRPCEASDVRLHCNSSCTDSSAVVRWTSPDGTEFKGRVLLLQGVRRSDGGSYACELLDYALKPRLRVLVKIDVQFAPVIAVPNSSVSVRSQWEEPLECQWEASPAPSVTWLLGGIPVPFAPPSTTETSGCRTASHLFLALLRNESSPGEWSDENFTCVAENHLGKAMATFILQDSSVFPDGISNVTQRGRRRQFNVTGFIVGMLPPLLISFYIILKLGYRSRYAEERNEDDGFRDEPFFISY